MANRVRCLAHIVNLVIKVILCQFDFPKKKKKNDSASLAPSDSNVLDLASGDQTSPRSMKMTTMS